MSETLYIGLDISKTTFDACLLREEGKQKHKVFPNTPEGHDQFLQWADNHAKTQPVHYCMEATGAYHQELALFLAQQERHVSVVNPFTTHHAAKAQGRGNKTDKADAHSLARYAKAENPRLWHAPPPEVRVLTALLRRRETLEQQQRAEENRLGLPGVLPRVAASLRKSIDFLQEEISALEEEINTHIEQSPRLREDRALLVSLPGIGVKTAGWLLGEMPDVSLFSSGESLAAYAGVAPCEHRSGTSVHRPSRMHRRGNVRLRTALYFPAVSALRYNPVVRSLAARLRAKGLCGKQVIVAAMRKLLLLAYGVLKSRQPFDPQWHAKAARNPA